MEILINTFTNKYICFYSLFKVRGVWHKGQLLEGGVVEKRLRTTATVVIELQNDLDLNAISIKNASVALEQGFPTWGTFAYPKGYI